MSAPGRGAAPRHEADVRTAAAAGPSAASPVQVGQYCGHCGDSLADGDHAGCSASLALEPPRFCAACRRRMMVQVVPLGWTARCSRHGEATSYA